MQAGTGQGREAVRTVEVGDREAGQRIDNFLLRELKGVPKSVIYRILRKGEVRVNRGRIKPDYRLKAGDAVRIPPLRVAADDGPPAIPPQVIERLRGAVLYEDEQLLVLDKPPGLAVHGGSGLAYGLIEALRAARPGAELELVHRLDRETSGCLMIAKSRTALRDLHDQLQAGTIEKRYLALVAGQWQGGVRTVELALRKQAAPGGERRVAVDDDGKAARTHFRPVSFYPYASLVEAVLDSGRTHQIRVHAAELGHPLAGDDKYGDEAFNKRMARLGLKRLFLHAQSLSLRVPGSGAERVISAPLSDDLKQILERLEAPGAAGK